MDFIERIFHIYPDRGSGVVELGSVVTCVATGAIVAAVKWMALRRNRDTRRSNQQRWEYEQ